MSDGEKIPCTELVILPVIQHDGKMAFEYLGAAFTRFPSGLLSSAGNMHIRIFRGGMLFDEGDAELDDPKVKHPLFYLVGLDCIGVPRLTRSDEVALSGGNFEGLDAALFAPGDQIELSIRNTTPDGLARMVRELWRDQVLMNPDYPFLAQWEAVIDRYRAEGRSHELSPGGAADAESKQINDEAARVPFTGLLVQFVQPWEV